MLQFSVDTNGNILYINDVPENSNRKEVIKLVNTELLKEKITNSGKPISWLAKKCGLSRTGFYLKLNNVNYFTTGEVAVLCDELNITSLKEKDRIFFWGNVPNLETQEDT